jgi:hypothetical protein
MQLLNAILIALVASSSALAVTTRSDAIRQRSTSEYKRSLETREPVHPRDLQDIGNALKEGPEMIGYLMTVIYHLVKDGSFSEE